MSGIFDKIDITSNLVTKSLPTIGPSDWSAKIPGLLKTHTTKEGTWGKICVLKGRLVCVLEENPKEEVELNAKRHGVVEPQVSHHVTPLDEVEFYE